MDRLDTAGVWLIFMRRVERGESGRLVGMEF